MRCLTADQVAEILNIPKFRVYELCRKNLIPHVRLGRQVRFLESALREWVAAGGSSIRNEDKSIPRVAQR